MLESCAYGIIKEEGLKEGIQIGIQQEKLQSKRQAIYTALEARFELVPTNVMEMINQIDIVQALDELHRKAVTVKDVATFSRMITTVLTPA